ncbi:MAG: hypothetical protein LBE91_10215 [Tannerella sp.]|jgi:hypothetical protein|nr:hypothetical protein [Tannerella sp.]
MNIRNLLSLTTGAGFISFPVFGQPVQKQTADKPNVIIINVDDLGYGDVGCYGATKRLTVWQKVPFFETRTETL